MGPGVLGGPLQGLWAADPHPEIMSFAVRTVHPPQCCFSYVASRKRCMNQKTSGLSQSIHTAVQVQPSRVKKKKYVLSLQAIPMDLGAMLSPE